MEVFLASAVVFALAVLGMSLGAIFGRRSLKGHCGGGGGCGLCDDETPHECRHPETSQCEHAHSVNTPGDLVK
jgi:hypothetical protein